MGADARQLRTLGFSSDEVKEALEYFVSSRIQASINVKSGNLQYFHRSNSFVGINI